MTFSGASAWAMVAVTCSSSRGSCRAAGTRYLGGFGVFVASPCASAHRSADHHVDFLDLARRQLVERLARSPTAVHKHGLSILASPEEGVALADRECRYLAHCRSLVVLSVG